ncbi:MAG: ribosome-associated translation inhibitor RaiA [Bacteroidales bacterium]|nr:ribosome-associated translation inhibitor RaiA [Candidatus Colicola caccequi]
MKLNINSVNFEIAERLEKYIEKKTRRYERLLPSEEVIMELRLTVVKPETNLNKQTQIRILGNGPELFAEKTCDTFEQGIDLCLEALDKQLEKLKQR